MLPGKKAMDEQDSMDHKNDLRANFPRFSPMVMKNNQPIVALLAKVGASKGATPAQVALAWLMAQKRWIVPIPGTSKIDHLRENVGTVNVALTPDDLRELEIGMARLEVFGGRMDAVQMAQIGQD